MLDKEINNVFKCTPKSPILLVNKNDIGCATLDMYTNYIMKTCTVWFCVDVKDIKKFFM